MHGEGSWGATIERDTSMRFSLSAAVQTTAGREGAPDCYSCYFPLHSVEREGAAPAAEG